MGLGKAEVVIGGGSNCDVYVVVVTVKGPQTNPTNPSSTLASHPALAKSIHQLSLSVPEIRLMGGGAN
ncbi:hypothetical protein Pmani_036839 [Petrolisthes manimaculis]|uniref:Uncharacterized protein n=1 Tax=Petrolisthes manimaculis TaxID=1843537 RepID=A0AAE1NIP4_9EUCA|nr:hypothetical protein Pmani_036839 [Petrolisthes manimaculis]